MKPPGAPRLHVVPISFADAAAWVAKLHRHNRVPPGCKFCLAAADTDGVLHGVAMVGRPVARYWDDGLTLEVNRTCTDGTPNINSFLYRRCWRVAKEMGFRRIITYTRTRHLGPLCAEAPACTHGSCLLIWASESGGSLRGAGFWIIAERPARASWYDSTADERWLALRDPVGTGGVPRTVWEIAI